MNWRTWIKETLSEDEDVTDIVPADRIISSGLEHPPEARPFIIVRLFPVTTMLKEGIAHRQIADVSVHDEPGSYVRIDACLSAVRTALAGPVASVGGVACEWQGDSSDSIDEGFKTLFRSATFRLIGTGNPN